MDDDIDDGLLMSFYDESESFLKYIKSSNQAYIWEDISFDFDFSPVVSELESDIIFLKNSEYSGFESPLKSYDYVFIDRDGTFVPEFDHYALSFQSLRSAFWLNILAENNREVVILSSTSVKDYGYRYKTISFFNLIQAGSNGTRFIKKDKNLIEYKFNSMQSYVLNNIKLKIQEIYNTDDFKNFLLVGNGLQFKNGKIFISYRDRFKSCPIYYSFQLKDLVYKIVKTFDPLKENIWVYDNGKTITIGLLDERLRYFDKEQGVRFLLKHYCVTSIDRALVIGNSNSDYKMINGLKQIAYVIDSYFVTNDDVLKGKVKNSSDSAVFLKRVNDLLKI